MIRLGVCTGAENAKLLAEIGYNYIELALNKVADLDNEEYERLGTLLDEAGIRAEAMNCMLPGSIPVVGPKAEPVSTESYIRGAFARAAELGAKVIVFGSGGCRSVPEGFDREEAYRQIRDFLLLCGRQAEPRGLRVAVEPLRREESNMINFVSEAVELAGRVGLEQVGVLGDTYHMSMGGEDLSVLLETRGMLRHIHMARPMGRGFPRGGDQADRDGEYSKLFRTLKSAGYSSRVSIEAGTENFKEDAQAAFALLDAMRRAV